MSRSNNSIPPLYRGLLCAALLSAPTWALAQSQSQNPITAAQDAFGTGIGRESIGLYNPSNVRGFSPTTAGNIRIDGIYFDRAWLLTQPLVSSRTIKVGISALGTLFPAPTGIVDYNLRAAGKDRSITTIAGVDSWGAASLETYAALPLRGEDLTLNLGAAVNRNGFVYGADSLYFDGAAGLRWRPHRSTEIIAFGEFFRGLGEQAAPVYVPAGSYLPPKIETRKFDGPDWSANSGIGTTSGVLARFALEKDWLVQFGLFRSLVENRVLFTHLIADLEPDGSAHHLISLDRPTMNGSTSGELRVTRAFVHGPSAHLFHLSVRGRDRHRRFGGGELKDLGPTYIGRAVTAPKPKFHFSEQNRDAINQWTLGAAYEGRWNDVGELNLGIQKTNYRKRISRPGSPEGESTASPWLFNAAAAAYLSNRLSVYGGFTKGLEESGVAPANAANRGEPMPAILTSQRDAGVRYAITPDLRLIVGAFDIRKPYFNLDADNRFGLLGNVKNRGLEMSLVGKLTPRLDIVAGGVLLDGRVTGEAVQLGRVGEKPVGQVARTLRLDANWRPPRLAQWSFDMSVLHTSSRVATGDNLVEVPSRTTVELGARYRFQLGGKPATLRLLVSNLTNAYGLDVLGSGAYQLLPGRLASAYLTLDL